MQGLIDAFVRRVDAEGLPVEAIRAYQGDVLAGGHHWMADRPRNIYSHTKSYMSTAAGIAIAEGRLSLGDRLVDVLVDALPKDMDSAISAITLRDLLMMSSGLGRVTLMSPERDSGVCGDDYVGYVLSFPMQHPPGERFLYSNGDSYLAGRMVETRVGQTLRDYLMERLFAPLGMAYPEWEHCPQGHTFGASGLRLAIDDMMKLGRLYLRGGEWNGRRLVDPAWIQQATAAHIATPTENGNPWHMGYGYQFWRSPYPDAYRADGAYGQITTVLPHADAVVAIQCEESERFPEIQQALHDEVLSRLS